MKFLKKFTATKVALVSTIVAFSGTASANITEQLTAAVTAGESNVTLAVGGIITISALLFGLGAIVSLMKRS